VSTLKNPPSKVAAAAAAKLPVRPDVIMDYAASRLELLLILYHKGLGAEYIWRLRGAIKLLRHPPEKNRGMRG
jgi:hypothetical protein